MNRIFNQVPQVLFASGSFSAYKNLLPHGADELNIAYLIDDVHKTTGLLDRLQLNSQREFLLLVSNEEEPTSFQIDEITKQLYSYPQIDAIVGIGGGSILDIAKAVSVLLTNEGSAADFQGWNLVKNPGVYKLGIPTLSGTGSEGSCTAVFTSPEKKMGINSMYSRFDAILLDPELIADVPKEQRFYTAMDCYIHSVEALNGCMINEMGRAYAEKALSYCKNVFLQNGTDEELMVASYFGASSVANSEVGVCHALSYGMSLVHGYRHGIANCIVFDKLEDYYPKGVQVFRDMLKKHQINLPKNINSNLKESDLQKMIDMAYRMEKPLMNALGDKWREIFSEEKIKNLYFRM